MLDRPLSLEELIGAEKDSLVTVCQEANYNGKGGVWMLNHKKFDENTFEDVVEDKFVQAISLANNNFTRIDFLKAPALQKLLMIQNKITRPMSHNNYPQL